MATTTLAVTVPSTINNNQVSTLLSPKGKTLGNRVKYGGALSAKEVSAVLKEQGLKGNALTKKVNEVLTGKTPMAWAEHDAMTSALRSMGYVPDHSDVKSKSALTRFVKPAEEKVKAGKISRLDALKALGLSEEDLAVLANRQAIAA